MIGVRHICIVYRYPGGVLQAPESAAGKTPTGRFDVSFILVNCQRHTPSENQYEQQCLRRVGRPTHTRSAVLTAGAKAFLRQLPGAVVHRYVDLKNKGKSAASLINATSARVLAQR